MTLTLLDWFVILPVVGAAVLYLGDSINSCTAAIRELAEIVRRDKP